MTISTTTNQVSFPGNGAQTIFDFNFLIPEGAMRVYLTENGVATLVPSEGYGVNGFGDDIGGTITLINPPTATQTVTIRRYLNPTQTTDLLPPMTAYVDAVEGVLDRHAMVMQQLSSDLSRAVLVPVGTGQTPDEILEEIINGGKDNTPVGQVAAFAMATPPAGWLECNGAAVGRETYADLYAAIGDVYGSGDGAVSFNLPDLRGEFLRGLDNGRGVDAGRMLGSSQEGEFETHQHETTTTQESYAENLFGRGKVARYGLTAPSARTDTSHLTSAVGGDETRPRNVAVIYCIKAFNAVTNQAMLEVGDLVNDIASVSVNKQDTIQVLHVCDEKPNGTHGGAGVPGSYLTRDLNTVLANTVTDASLDILTNQITLPAGVYKCSAISPFANTGAGRARLYDVTNSRVLIMGNNAYSEEDGLVEMQLSHLNGAFTLTSIAVIELQMQVAGTYGWGLGVPASFGDPEVYSNVIIEKLS